MKTLKQLNTYSTTTVTFTDQAAGIGQILPNRYQINGLIDTKNSVLDNIERLCSASGSWLSYDTHEGKWGVVINQTGTSIASFNDSNIIGSITLNGTGLNDLYNSTKVEFPHRDLRDNPDFVSIEIPSGDRNANEFDNTLALSYDVINEPVQAQLLGFTELKQSRIDLVINFRTDYSYINLKAGDLVAVTNSRFNFTNKLFRIITITEIQEDAGPLMMEISALEYNSTIYSTTDLYRYTRTDENGIVTIGSIGIPGTPQVTKFEIDARPGILVESLAPTGVVEAMEFWISNDVQLTEENRTYRILGEVKPINGGIFASSDQVRLEYDNLSASDFVIKTRGKNSATTGPYSAVSGFTNFNPTQVTQGIDSNTKAVNALGGIVTALAVIDLLKGVDGIYQKVFSTGSLFTSIFETFKEYTGIDLTEAATTGGLSPQDLPYIVIKDEGNTLTNKVSEINFIGDGVVTTQNGNSVTVTIGSQTVPGDGTTIVIDSACGVNKGDIPMWNGEKWTTSSDCCDPDPDVCALKYIEVIQKYPPDRATYQDPINNLTSDTAPITGSYYLRFGGKTFYGPMNKGSGSASLYKSDGTLVETIDAADAIINKNVLNLPFATRELGTDYYILVDEGFVTYCNYINRALLLPTDWNFNTPLYEADAYDIVGNTVSPTIRPISLSTTPSFIQFQNVSGTFMVKDSDPCTVGVMVPGSGRSVATFDAIKTGNATVLKKTPGQINTGYKVDDIIHINARDVGANSGIITVTITETCNGDIISFTNTAIPNVKLGPCSQLLLNASDLAVAGTGNITISDGTNSQTIDASTGVVYDDGIINFGELTGKVTLGGTHTITLPDGAVKADPASEVDCYLVNVGTVVTTCSNISIINSLELTGFTVSSAPIADNDLTKVNPQTQIILSFNETVILGDSGTITLHKSDGTIHQAFDVTTSFDSDNTSEIIWCDTNKIYLNPTRDLNIKTTYYVTASNGSVKSHCVTWSGINDSTTVRFSTDSGPTLTSTSSAITTSSTQFISYETDRGVVGYTGTAKIYDDTNTLVKEIAGTDAAVSIT